MLASESNLGSGSHGIGLSDGAAKKKKRVFFGGMWNAVDKVSLCVVVMMHGLALCAPFYFNWKAFWVAVALAIITGLLGICLSYHRNLTHGSLQLPKWLEYFCAYCGVLALQGSPTWWVNTHSYHHQYVDGERDPHSPTQGFWFSHINWIFNTRLVYEKCGKLSNAAKKLEEQPFYRFTRRTYFLHPIALALLLHALGDFPYVVWGMGVRTIYVYHITWSINSVCHTWGTQTWNTGDLSKNNWLVALLSLGEGWHNNHHAFEYSARQGLEWWQVDVTWYTIRLLQVMGLAKHVKLPTEAHKQRLSFNSTTSPSNSQ